jgi:chemotaxis protein histidine kinase CheA
MTDRFSHKKFIFNDKIDSDFLFSLYEDDFMYMEEIFKTTLDQLNTVVTEVPAAFTAKNVVELRRIVHKIKPAFGFTGFLQTEKACKDFEDACTETINADKLAGLYQPFWSLLTDSMDTMKLQYDQLKDFNKQ